MKFLKLVLHPRRIANRIKREINSGLIRAFGPGYTRRKITAGPNAGLNFIAARRVGYSTHFWNGLYELESCRFLAQIIQPEAVCYDIGAHLGYHTLIMARAAHQGWVYAFEPILPIQNALEQNLAINGLVNVTVVDQVVSDKTGVINLGHNVANNMAAVKFASGGQSRSRPIIQCKATTLDDFVKVTGVSPSLLKIDIEGAEVEALLGAKQVMETYRPLVLCETHGSESARQVYDLLQDYRYELFNVQSALLPIKTAHDMPINMFKGHVFGRPKTTRPGMTYQVDQKV